MKTYPGVRTENEAFSTFDKAPASCQTQARASDSTAAAAKELVEHSILFAGYKAGAAVSSPSGVIYSSAGQILCISGCANPSGVRGFPRIFQLSPTNPAGSRFASLNLPLPRHGTPNNHFQQTIVRRRPSDFIQSRFELGYRQVLYVHSIASTTLRGSCCLLPASRSCKSSLRCS
jgi:hypothetical protein